MLNIHYRVWLAAGEPLEEHVVLPLVFRPEYSSFIIKILRNMQAILKKGLPESLRLSILAHEIVLRHLTSTPLREKEHKIIDARLMEACRRMSSPDCMIFKAEEMARFSGLSISQMNRLFRKCFRMTPHKFWEQRRFMELCRQLRATDLPASKIAAQFRN